MICLTCFHLISYIIGIDTNVATTATASGATGVDAVTAHGEEKDEGGDEIVETAVALEEESSGKEDDVVGEVQQEKDVLIIEEEEGGRDDDYQEYMGSLVDEAKGSMPNDALFGLSVNTSIDKAAATIGEAAQSLLRSPTIKQMLSFNRTSTTAKSIEAKPRRSSRLNPDEST